MIFRKNFISAHGIYFKGFLLIISNAPEPTEIIWENLHKTNSNKFKVRIITHTLTMLLLFSIGIGIYFLVYVQQKYFLTPIGKFILKGEFKKKGTFSLEFSNQSLLLHFTSFCISIAIILINKVILQLTLQKIV